MTRAASGFRDFVRKGMIASACGYLSSVWEFCNCIGSVDLKLGRLKVYLGQVFLLLFSIFPMIGVYQNSDGWGNLVTEMKIYKHILSIVRQLTVQSNSIWIWQTTGCKQKLIGSPNDCTWEDALASDFVYGGCTVWGYDNIVDKAHPRSCIRWLICSLLSIGCFGSKLLVLWEAIDVFDCIMSHLSISFSF